MARYAAIELSVGENGDLRFPEKFSKEERDKLQRGDVVYIYYGTKSKKMYIGQTSRFIYRHREHYSKDISFPPADFNSVIVLYSQLFNKSSILDVEKQLINYFLAETPKKSARKILFDEDSLINKTTGDHVNEYTEMEDVASDVILPFWEKELVPRGLAKTPTIKELQSRALVKYSPIKKLSDEQARISDEIIGNDKNYVICGDAGTGKTVMLTTLAARFLKEKPKAKIAPVLQPNWEKTYRKIFDVFGSESRRLTVTSSTKLIKSGVNLDSTHTDRILAGLVEKWKQTDGKDSSVMHWHESSIHRRWNSTQENRLNSDDKDAAAQIGSVFAVQGNDLNKVGVLIGADIEVDENGKLKADPQNFHNTNGKFSVDEMLESENQREFTLFVLNIYYVLLTRGIDGIRIGFWHNDAFMKYMEETPEINREDV